MIAPRLLQQTSVRAKASLKRHLLKRLKAITRPCFQLEWKSFVMAMNSLGLAASSDSKLTARMFVGDRPHDRLESLFKKFPVLPDLWCLAITQWCDHSSEVLGRVARDRAAISDFFFEGKPLGKIRNVRPGLSDPHDGGRSVTMVEFDKGRVIYKPRAASSEIAWNSTLSWMNSHGLRRGLRAARILESKRYYWMEYVEAVSCKNEPAVRRLYERLGGMIAAVYVLKAVDCHRENVIVAGEYPILVDTDAIWHVSPLTATQSPSDLLYRTGFFPNSRPNSLQSVSSVLGGSLGGRQLARVRNELTNPACYGDEILRGFFQGWRCLLGTRERRAAFERRAARVRAQKRRWIYCATQRYAGILRASLEPAALRSSAARARVVRRLCSRPSVSQNVVKAEIKSLMQLDIPYFTRRTQGWMPREKVRPPAELKDAIRQALGWITERGRGTNQLRQKK
ncbi:MAG TPA: DUF4135 domain-containing protein [Chthoniobacterales bacterium]